MRFTNAKGLPRPLESALTGRIKPFVIREDIISLTNLLQPVQQLILMERHDGEIIEDVAERVWLLFGLAMHKAMEDVFMPGVILEVPLDLKVSGWTVTMKVDVIEPNMISDYKITSAWSEVFMDDRKKYEFASQLNPYRVAYHQTYGPLVDNLQIVNVYRDWQKSKQFDRGYPTTPFGVHKVDAWDVDQTMSFLTQRLASLEDNHPQASKDLLECTKEEIWAKPTVYAVMKKGAKKSSKNCSTEKEATRYADTKAAQVGGSWSVETRPGKNTRCEDYCVVKPFCEQYGRTTDAIKNQN